MTAAIHRDVIALANPVRAKHSQRFFKTGPGEYGHGDRFLGLSVPQVRALESKHRSASLTTLTRLLRSKWHEERLLALIILVRQYRSAGASEREAIFRLYLRSTDYINNWDLVDCSAWQIVGAHLAGGGRARLVRLARSKSLWERRIAIIATAYYINHGEFGDTLKMARILRDDPHDLIHKAVGWMLREVGKRDRAVEEKFLRQHAARMPRTMLRYAIEKFPQALRRRYLRTTS
ncbi:MAG: DNA alkylation repair protein [Gemmatimonadales bacterium]